MSSQTSFWRAFLHKIMTKEVEPIIEIQSRRDDILLKQTCFEVKNPSNKHFWRVFLYKNHDKRSFKAKDSSESLLIYKSPVPLSSKK